MPNTRFAQSLRVLLLCSAAVHAQTAQPAKPAPAPAKTSTGGTLAIAGHPETTPLLQINGRNYVDVEALARITNGSLRFKGSHVTLQLPSAAPAADQPPPPIGFSRPFLNASIEAMTEIREWRVALLNAVQNNYPVSDPYISPFRRSADSKLAIVSTAVPTDSDRSGFTLLQNEFRNMQRLSDTYLQRHQNVQFTQSNALDNDPLNQQVLACAQGLANLAATGQYEDVSACH